ncbi:MAG TPA: energy transducer TonB [Terriglobales bacterium]|nr:energy transducer TonB [Terriglobales bacterium]
MALIKLLADQEDDTLPPPPPHLRGADFPIDDLLLELRDQRLKAKRREAAFLSVIVHLTLVILLLLSPKLFGPVRIKMATPQQDLQRHQFTYLEMPKDLITPKKAPRPKVLSDRDRHFDNPTKMPDSISAPVTRPAPRPQPSNPPPGPPAPQPAPASPPPAAPPAAAPAPPKPQPSSAPEGLKLEDIPKPTTNHKLNLNIGAADQMQRAIEAAARDQASRGARVTETAPLPRPSQSGGSGSSAPGQTGAGVQILTDTQGVDFDPYLRRVVEIVRRNWYAVMPETVYLGTQGKVVVIFNINANGSVPAIHPVGLSGTASLDQAAEASISASNPFPPLPSEFHGPFITLQFSFYYNLTPPN